VQLLMSGSSGRRTTSHRLTNAAAMLSRGHGALALGTRALLEPE
jgi:hypothetical protein